VNTLKKLLRDKTARWLLIGGFVYAWFFSQGVPLWDDDFTSWFWKIKDNSIFKYVFEWLSPISTQPQYWGFNERPAQALFYKVCYLISGYESWSYFFFKSVVYAGMGFMVYAWGLRLTASARWARPAAAAGAVFFLLTPGPMASHVIQSDLAPIAELWFLVVTYLIWEAVEETPAAWAGMPKLSDPAVKTWVKHWLILSFAVYLGYKTKADLKMIPAILAVYVLIVRRKQWKYFAIPVAAMLLLAVPWGPGIFSKLPPFLPGSKGSEIGWMFQPASVGSFWDFVWPGSWRAFLLDYRNPTIAMTSLLGPFLLLVSVPFLLWKMEAFDKVKWGTQETSVDRARTFALIWLGIMAVAVSALAPINYIFRVRYGILLMVPFSILLCWVIGLFLDNVARLPKWIFYAAIAMFATQSSINLYRSYAFRRDMGIVMIAVDQIYEYVDRHFPQAKLALLPDFRPYDYRPSAGPAVLKREWLQSTDELVKKYVPGNTYVISWSSSMWDQLEMVERFSGCRETTVFDRLFPCPAGSGTYLMKFIGTDPLYVQGEALRSKGDQAGARKLHEQFLAKYPKSLAGNFVWGLENFSLQDWPKAEQAFGFIETYQPENLSIVYNHALALAELKRYPEAITRLEMVASRDPRNYAVLINLYWNYVKAQEKRQANALLKKLKEYFPNDGGVQQLKPLE